MRQRICGWAQRRRHNNDPSKASRTIMDYEHFVVAAARVVEFVGVAVLLLGALLAAAAFSRRLVQRATFQDAYHALRADLGRADPARARTAGDCRHHWDRGDRTDLAESAGARRDRGDPDTSELRARVGSERALAVAARAGRWSGRFERLARLVGSLLGATGDSVVSVFSAFSDASRCATPSILPRDSWRISSARSVETHGCTPVRTAAVRHWTAGAPFARRGFASAVGAHLRTD